MTEILFGKEVRHKFIFNAAFHISTWQAVSPASLQCPFLGFFWKFCDVAKVAIIQEKTSQIWLYTRSEIFQKKRNFHIIGYLLELIIMI